MESIDFRFEQYATTLIALEYIGGIFLILTIAETLWDFIKGTRKGWKETAANFAIALGSSLLERTAFGLVFIVGLQITEQFAFTRLAHNWWSWALALISADFTYYWMHRFEHEIRFFWAYHSVHHSSPEYNLTTAMRLAWIEGLFEWLFFIPMILIGFDMVQTIIALFIVVIYQTWIHTEKISKLGFLDKIFNTPSVHRVHHGSNEKYLDKSYGGILIIWDRMFGTFQAEEETVIYGITTPLGTSNPLTINITEFADIAKDAWRSGKLKNALGYIFGPPGWQPRQHNTDTKKPDGT